MYTQGGVSRFTRGIGPSVLRAFPVNSLLFVIYEVTALELEEYYGL